MDTTTLRSITRITPLLFFLLPLSGQALTPSEVFERVKDSVFVVKTFDAKGEQKLQGSGVLLPSGKVGTNCHLVKDGMRYEVGGGKDWVLATLYAADGDKDICLLDAKGIGGTAAQLGKAADLKVGAPVYAVGAPQGLELSLSDGIVSQLRGGPPPFIQTTAAISHGSSGGGLFDSEARLVGFTTLYIDGGQSLNFAMPVEWAADIRPGSKLVATGRGQMGWLARYSALGEHESWQEMLDWGREWTQSDPKNGNAWFVLGNAYYYLNRYTAAIDTLRQALRIDPELAGAWGVLGRAYRKLNRYTDAINAYHQALRINPESGAWFNLGLAYAELNRYTDAIDAYRQALRIDPEDAKVWYNLGITYYDLDRYTDAIDAFRQAVRINPEYAKAWYNLGVTYGRSGNRTAALEVVQILRRLDPGSAEELLNLIVPR